MATIEGLRPKSNKRPKSTLRPYSTHSDNSATDNGLRPKSTLRPNSGLRPYSNKIIVEPPLDPTRLRLGQYELGERFRFGTRTRFAVPNSFLVESFAIDQGDIQTVDYNLPFEDGTGFGEDFHSGSLISFRINLWNKGEDARYDLAEFVSEWKRKEYRNSPQAFTSLRMNKGGDISVCYGRPRRIKPEWGMVENGWCPIDCDFQMIEDAFYEDEVQTKEITLSVLPSSGLSYPAAAPFKFSQYTSSQYVVDIGGTEPTWILQKITGPLASGELLVDGERWWKFKKDIPIFSKYTIDPRPLRRLTLKNETITDPGIYTSDSILLREMKLEPGRHEIVLRGIDPTLTAKLILGWRNRKSSP